MDDPSIERKLKLLKESLDAGIIDLEEYHLNKAKLEQKPKEQPVRKEAPAFSHKDETPEAHAKKAAASDMPPKEEHSGKGGEHPPQSEIDELIDPIKGKIKPIPSSEDERQGKKIHEKRAVHAPETSLQKKTEPKKKEERHTLVISLWVIGALLLLGMLVFLSITLEKAAINETKHKSVEKNPPIACSTHTDCRMPGKEYRCLRPGTPDASCERKDAVLVNVTILNSDGCSPCDTSRVLGILWEWFPGAQMKKTDASSDEGKSLVKEYSITMLPAYILSNSAEHSLLFSEVKAAFRASGSGYAMKDGASGAVLYLGRKEKPKTLDIFLAPDEESSKKAVLNMKEFTDAFTSEATFTVHIVSGTNSSEPAACISLSYPDKITSYLSCSAAESPAQCLSSNGISALDISSCVLRGEGGRIIENEAALLKSLGLPTPSFLLNNNQRISGVQAADSLRSQYCERNPGSLCGKELRKSLV